MDPITHGLLGGVAAQAACGRPLPRTAWVIGTAADLTPDLDIFIRSANGPLGGLTYHRHFTHSLAFALAGAAAVSLPLLVLPAFRKVRAWVGLAALVGYVTHGLLDACTSFGTLLWWPFSRARVAWDLIAIIDPVFTAILLAGLLWAGWSRRRRFAIAALGGAGLYLCLGAVQHERATAAQRGLAARRGHAIVRGRVLPTPLNLIVWRSVYEAEGRLYTDSVRVPPWGEASVRVGSSSRRATPADLQAERPVSAAVRSGFEQFEWFADGYTAFAPGEHVVVCDLRYGGLSDDTGSTWGLRLPGPGEDRPPQFVRAGARRGDGLHSFWNAVVGRDPHFTPLALLPAPPSHAP